MQIGYCPRCNVPIRGNRCDICNTYAKILRFHDLGDIRPASRYEIDVLQHLLPFRELRNYIKKRLVLFARQPGLDYRKDVFLDGYKFGTLEYIKDERWRWRFVPSGKGARFIYDLVGHIDFEIEASGHIKGKKISREIDGDWAIVYVSGCIGVATKSAKGAKIKDVYCRKIKNKSRSDMEKAVLANINYLEEIERSAVRKIRESKANYVAFSGGKDSEVVVYLAKKAGVKKAIFLNTGLEFPETVRFVRKFAEMMEIELIEKEPSYDFWSVVKEKGIPTKDNRWCTSLLKLENLKSFSGVIVDGTRRYESFARMFRSSARKIGNLRVVYPILDWLALDVWMFIKWKGLPYNILYDMGYERIGCFMCPAMLNAEFHNLKRTHPQLFRIWYNYLRNEGFTRDEIMDGLWRWRNLPAKLMLKD